MIINKVCGTVWLRGYDRAMSTAAQPLGRNPDGSDNTRPRPRPRFDLVVDHAPLEVLERLRRAAAASPEISAVLLECGGSATDAPRAEHVHKVELTLQGERSRIWSPQLACLVAPRPDGAPGALLKARFGPHPQIWGLYLAGYATSAILTAGLLILGLVQIWLGESPWALWAAPLAMLITALTWGAAFVGQGLGAGQMHDLRRFLDDALA